jgi:heme-degrading monooxygenase HmoA
MPALPWVERQAIDPDREYVAMASRLPLKRYRSIPGFLRGTLAVRRQLARTRGLVGYALNAEPARKRFWTFSVWEDRASLNAFAAADPHRRIIRRLAPLMDETRFEFFPISGSQLPMTWDRMSAPVREPRPL